ncbi:MAG: hypothetical protein CMQ15_01535 [Gammaproteobacteria bacterium]|jgi:hypothetical protein|nr:hypothetical protein [Gammaproteobacteria bacterium]|tara:strand:+ start:1040 stop:1255 length:216 start_codon:yes stop_codon:yes gene_type:complete
MNTKQSHGHFSVWVDSGNITSVSLDVIEKLVKDYPNNMELGEEVRKMYHKIMDMPIVDDAGCDVETGKFLG